MSFILVFLVAPEGHGQCIGFNLAILQFNRKEPLPLRRVQRRVVNPLEIQGNAARFARHHRLDDDLGMS
jgi:hypothetical protein